MLNTLSGRMPSKPDVRSVGKALVLSFKHVCFSLATFLGPGMTVPCICYELRRRIRSNVRGK
jgi:hypothetical protein